MELAIKKNNDLVRVYDDESNAWKVVKKTKSLNAQLATIEETLSKFGLIKNEIRVYLHLARAGEKKAGEIAEAISLHRTETYRILRDLEKKGIIFSIFKKPLKFTAVPLEKAIDILINVQKFRIRLLEKEKATLVNMWLSIPQSNIERAKKELFQMLEGEQQVLLKIEELLAKTKREFKILAPDDYLAKLYYSDFLDRLKRSLNKIDIMLLTQDSPKSNYFIEQTNWPEEKHRTVEASNHPDLPCFMISDKKELLIAFHDSGVTNENYDKKKPRTVALWTNYTAFINTLQMLFLKLMDVAETKE
jgi:sugar-specific transcriptional regulator TrmB